MNCKYSYQGELVNDRHYLYCNINNKDCIFIRYCERINDIISSDGYKNCPILTEKERTIGMTKEKEHKVLFEKRGMLAVELNDKDGQVVMAEHSFEGEIPPYVALSKRDGKYYAK